MCWGRRTQGAGPSLRHSDAQASPSLKAVDRAEASAASQARSPSTGAGRSLSLGTPRPHPALVLSSSSGLSICTPSPPRHLLWR